MKPFFIVIFICYLQTNTLQAISSPPPSPERRSRPQQVQTTPKRQPTPLQAATDFITAFRGGTIPPIKASNVRIVGENHENRAAKLYLWGELTAEYAKNGGILVMEHLTEEEHGEDLAKQEMTEKLKDYLHDLDQGFDLENKEQDESPGTFFSIVKRCFDLKIPVIPLELSIRVYRGDTTRRGVARMKIITWRAYKVSLNLKNTYPNQAQLWFVGSAHLHSLPYFGHVPGIGDVINSKTIQIKKLEKKNGKRKRATKENASLGSYIHSPVSQVRSHQRLCLDDDKGLRPMLLIKE